MEQSSLGPELGTSTQKPTLAPGVSPSVEYKVSQILTDGEQILYIVGQHKPILNIQPDCVVLTNRRFIIYRPKFFGRVTFDDYIWRDLSDAKLKEGFWGATFSLKTVAGLRLSIDWLPKAPARKVYSIAQGMEEMVREERRIRDMEEQRAGAGGIVLQGSAPAGQPQPPMAVPDDPTAKLTQLKTMMDTGLISLEEYEAKKSEILSRM